ncbi:MAG: hypothetical protein LBE56_12970 [Tannerella sp.]|jgi:hypothetical protein|nr:hypothetical protein [Tannerella sp.]
MYIAGFVIAVFLLVAVRWLRKATTSIFICHFLMPQCNVLPVFCINTFLEDTFYEADDASNQKVAAIPFKMARDGI